MIKCGSGLDGGKNIVIWRKQNAGGRQRKDRRQGERRSLEPLSLAGVVILEKPSGDDGAERPGRSVPLSSSLPPRGGGMRVAWKKQNCVFQAL